jgi:CO/xanthine dehydrogenase FAD-binding subunit
MKPPIFDYYDPETEGEALELLGAFGSEAKLLAGGQSLMPLLNMRLVSPGNLIDLNRLNRLNYINETPNALYIGALTRQRQLEYADQVKRSCPLLQEAVRYVGYPQIRSRGTLGGSLSHADPAAELPAVMTALEAQFEVKSHRGSRLIDCQDFFVDYLTTALAADEMLCEIRIPQQPAHTGWSFMEMQRVAGAFAIVGVAAVVNVDQDGRCHRVRLAFTGIGSVPQRANATEAALQGAVVDAALLRDVCQLADSELDPESDIHGSAAYRKNLARVLAQRTLTQAFQRARVSQQRDSADKRHLS